MNKKIIISSLAFGAITIAGIYGISSVEAFNGQNNRDSVVEKVAERFSLSTGEVEEVFNENRAERQVMMQEKHEERLSQLVENGNLTEEQKQLILDKMEAERAERNIGGDDFRNMAPEEKREARNSHREEMQQWMEENEIDDGLMMGIGKGMNKGQGHGGFGMGK